MSEKLRALIANWRNMADSFELTRGDSEVENAYNGCAQELEAALAKAGGTSAEFDVRAWLKERFPKADYHYEISYNIVAQDAYAAGRAAAAQELSAAQVQQAMEETTSSPMSPCLTPYGLKLLTNRLNTMLRSKAGQ